MKRYFLILIIGLAGLSFGCEKQQLTSERNRDEILAYLDENNIDAIEHETGLFYIITEEGTGTAMPSPNATVEAKYKGYFMDGTVFDETRGDNAVEFSLGQVIVGWRIGLTLMKKGGKATFFIPANLGYGFSGSGSVPPSTVILFDIELINFSG